MSRRRVGGLMRIRSGTLSLLLPLLLAACSPAFTGVSGEGLVRTGYPRAVITAEPPLRLMAYGRRYVTLKSDIMMLQPTGAFDYAVYSDSTDGPVTKSAHSIILRPTDERRWRFVLESWKAPNAFAMSSTGFDGMTWTEQLMTVPSEGDWFSDMWRASGREVPERWLVKRFSATPAEYVRMVAEYRESWPACLPDEIQWLELVPNAGECLGPFLKRADAAFSIQRGSAGSVAAPAAPSILTEPSSSPNPTKLAGEVEQRDLDFPGFRRF